MSGSPLSEVIGDRRINSVLESIRSAVHSGQVISIAPKEVDYIRRSLHSALSYGERKLYELAQTFLEHFSGSRSSTVTLEVWGRCIEAGHSDEVVQIHFDLTSNVSELLSTTDSMLALRHAPECPKCHRKSNVIASFVRYDPAPVGENPLLFLSTRIKTTSNISYKLADMVFDIDRMFQRDKIFTEFRQSVSDVYGVKIVVKDGGRIDEVVHYVRSLAGANIVEEKDYIGANKKKSGFEAYKLVANLDDFVMEVQIQSLAMFENEQVNRSANHQTYKEKQMAERRKLGKEYSQLYQALIRLFAEPNDNVCELDYVEFSPGGKGLDDEF